MRKLAFLAATTLVCLSAPSMAADFTVTPVYSHLGAADFDGASGDVKTSSYGLVGNNDFLTLGYTKTEYDFSNRPDVDMNKVFADLRYAKVNPGTLGYFVGGGLAFGWEDDFHPSENYSITPRAGLNYDFGNEWRVTGGLSMNINEIENYFQPIFMVHYRSPDSLGFSGVFGTKNHAQYRFTNAMAVEGTLRGIDRDIYQLSDDNSKHGSAAEGYLMERSIAASAGVVLNPLDALTLRAGVEARFDRELKVYDKDGNKLGKQDIDPSYGLYINGSLSF